MTRQPRGCQTASSAVSADSVVPARKPPMESEQQPLRLIRGSSLPLLSLWKGCEVVLLCNEEILKEGLPIDRSLLELPATDRLHTKQNRSTAAWKLPVSGRPVFLKRHYRLPWFLRITAALAPTACWSPALREWVGLRVAGQLGISVPKPLAAGQFLGPALRAKSFLVVEELQGFCPLHELVAEARRLLAPTSFEQLVKALLRAIAQIAARLHSHGCFHRDLYLCHYFAPRTSLYAVRITPSDLVLIDFHRLKRCRCFPWRWVIKDIAQLLFSLQEAQLHEWAAQYFFVRYSYDRGRRPSRLLWRCILWKRQRYWDHNYQQPATTHLTWAGLARLASRLKAALSWRRRNPSPAQSFTQTRQSDRLRRERCP